MEATIERTPRMAVGVETRRAVAVVAGPMIGAMVVAVFGWRDFWWVALAASLGTSVATFVALRQRESWAFRTMTLMMVPPTVLFLPTILAAPFGFIGGFLSGLLLLPLIGFVLRRPERAFQVTAV